MRILIKPGVIIGEINGPFMRVCYAVYDVWGKRGLVPMLTSARDGQHMATSLHYKFLAWDFGILSLPDPWEVAKELRERLNKPSNDFDVIYGDKDHLDHVHIEFQTLAQGGSPRV